MKKKKWIDEAGHEIPEHRITQTEKLAEKYSSQILASALKANAALQQIKLDIELKSRELFDEVMKEANVDLSQSKHKGNFSWYNFDRSVKIEVSIAERVVFDEALIEACKEKLLLFINKNISSGKQFIKDLILDAFQTSKGKLDTKKIMYLLKYKAKINEPLYSEAMDLLEKSIRRPDKKVYFRVSQRESNGEYKNIELNFSAI